MSPDPAHRHIHCALVISHCTVYEGEVPALQLMLLQLRRQPACHRRVLGEQNQARRIPVDSLHGTGHRLLALLLEVECDPAGQRTLLIVFYRVNHHASRLIHHQQIGIFSDDLSFDPRAVEVLKQSFIEMGLLKDIPEDKAMFTTQFLPVKAGL